MWIHVGFVLCHFVVQIASMSAPDELLHQVHRPLFLIRTAHFTINPLSPLQMLAWYGLKVSCLLFVLLVLSLLSTHQRMGASTPARRWRLQLAVIGVLGSC